MTPRWMGTVSSVRHSSSRKNGQIGRSPAENNEESEKSGKLKGNIHWRLERILTTLVTSRSAWLCSVRCWRRVCGTINHTFSCSLHYKGAAQWEVLTPENQGVKKTCEKKRKCPAALHPRCWPGILLFSLRAKSIINTWPCGWDMGNI